MQDKVLNIIFIAYSLNCHNLKITYKVNGRIQCSQTRATHSLTADVRNLNFYGKRQILIGTRFSGHSKQLNALHYPHIPITHLDLCRHNQSITSKILYCKLVATSIQHLAHAQAMAQRRRYGSLCLKTLHIFTPPASHPSFNVTLFLSVFRKIGMCSRLTNKQYIKVIFILAMIKNM